MARLRTGREAVGSVVGGTSEDKISRSLCSKLSILDFIYPEDSKNLELVSYITTINPSKKVPKSKFLSEQRKSFRNVCCNRLKTNVLSLDLSASELIILSFIKHSDSCPYVLWALSYLIFLEPSFLICPLSHYPPF